MTSLSPLSHLPVASLPPHAYWGLHSHVNSSLLTSIGVTQFRESVSSRITLDDEDPAIIARMLLYIYINTYPVSNIAAEGTGRGQFSTITDQFKNDAFDKPEWAARANLHALMFAAAEKSWVLGLEKHTAHRFVAAFCESTDYALWPEKGILDRSSGDGMNTSSDEENFNSQSQLARGDAEPSATPGVVDDWTIEAPIIRQVYTSTSTHCHTLRNVIVWQMKHSIAICADNDYANGSLESESILALLRELPELAFDLASSVMTKRSYRCSNCNDVSHSLVTRCKCGKLDRCVEPECLQRMQQESICTECYCFGTMLFTAEDVDNDDNGNSI